MTKIYCLLFGALISPTDPIAIVVAGLLAGNRGGLLAMSDTVREHLDTFWELVDEVLNAVLFVMIGLEVLITLPSRPPRLSGSRWRAWGEGDHNSH